MPSIDQRVVEMQFNNRQFESGVETTIKSLDNLKESLNFKGASAGLSELESFGRGLDFSGISGAVETISDKFSTLGIIGVTALQNITNKAVDAGVALVKSLSTDQITAGWDKYADKTSAVQTIMAATAKDFTDTGKQMEYVNEQLDKLNWFTDETSYNFLEMVNNIGKFTNNNIPLEEAVTSMQGISTWAALAGANSNEASRVMYNLSQAISVGAVKLQDWKSIENANMATAEFKETAMQTAVELGKLSKEFEILEAPKTYKGDWTVDVANFSQTLSSGWFSADVLTATLAKYGAFTDELYNASSAMEDQYSTVNQLLGALDEYKAGTLDITEIMENTGLTAAEVTRYFDTLSDSTMALGEKGFRAAQEAKTFKEAIDATKDAVSTGWMQTFELIFGDYQEAKRLWTDFANFLYDTFAETGNARNELLADWKKLGGRDALFEGITNSWEALMSVVQPIKDAFRDIFPPMTAQRLYEITDAVRNFTSKLQISSETGEKIRRIFKGVFSVFDIGVQGLKQLGSSFSRLFSNIKPVNLGFLDLAASIADFVTSIADSVRETGLFRGAFDGIVNILIKVRDGFLSFISALREGTSAITPLLKNVTGSFITFGSKVKDSLIDLSTKGLNVGIDAFKNFGKKVKETVDYIKENGIGGIKDFAQNIFKSFEPLVNAVKPIFKAALDVIKNFVKSLSGMEFSFEPAKSFFAQIGEFAKKLVPIFKNILETVGNFIKNLTEGMTLNDALDALNKGLFSGVLFMLIKFLKSLLDSIKKPAEIVKNVTDILGGIGDTLNAFQKSVKANAIIKIAGAIGILAVALIALSNVPAESLGAGITALSALVGEFYLITKGFSKLSLSGDKGTKTLLAIAAAMWVVSSSVKSLSGLNFKEITTGIFGVASVAFSLSGAMTLMDGSKTEKMAATLLAMAAAVKLLVGSVVSLGQMDFFTLTQGLLGLGGVILYISMALESGGLSGGNLNKSAVGILAMALAIKILQTSVSALGEMDFFVLAQGLGAIGVAMLGFSAVLQSANGANLNQSAIGFIAIAAAIRILESSVSAFGEMDLATLIQGLLGVTTALAGLAMFTQAASGATNMAQTSAGMLLLASAMIVLSKAVEMMGQLSIAELATGLATLAGSLALITASLQALPADSLAKSAGILALSAGLLMLAGVVKILGQLSWQEIAKGMTVVGVSLGAFTLALSALAPVATPAIPLILAIAAAIAAVGVAVLAAGKGIEFMARGFGAMTNLDWTTMSQALKEMAISIPIITAAAGLGAAAILGVDAAMLALAVSAPLAAGGLAIFINTLSRIIPEAVVQTTEGIENAEPTLNASMQHAGGSMLETLASVLRGGKNVVVGAVQSLGSMIIGGFKTLLGIESPSTEFASIGDYSAQGYANGLLGGSGSIDSALQEVSNSALSTLSGSNAQYASAGQNALSSFAKGFESDFDLESLIDSNPTITPVLDLSNLEGASGQIDALLQPNSGITVSNATLSGLTNSISNQNGSETQKIEFDDTAIVNELLIIQGRIASLETAIEGVGVYVDGDKFVGSIAKKMDTELGVLSSRKGRGI